MTKERGIAGSEMAAASAGTAVESRRVGVGVVPEGEVIILRIKPSLLFVVLSMLGPVVLCVAMALGLRWVSGRPMRFLGSNPIEFPDLGSVWMAPALLAVAILAWQLLEWSARIYLLTDRRVVKVSGVLRQLVIEVPLARVQQVVLHKSLRERLTGLGTPGIGSAGSGDLSYVFWNMVSRPAERLRVIRETVARYGGPGGGGKGEAA